MNIFPFSFTRLVEIRGKTTTFGQEISVISLKQCADAMCVVQAAKFQEFDCEWLPYPKYSPDLAPTNYFLLSNLKDYFEGQGFSCNDKIFTQTNANKLKKRWRTLWSSKETKLRNEIFF